MAGRGARLVVSGMAGDSGKTLVSLGLALAARERGLIVQAFKKGPDYIDAAWLAWATGRPARNLDTWMMGTEAVSQAFAARAIDDGLNLIEGNRGLFDGTDAAGTHSTAALARVVNAPVVLVVNARKMTRTAAAMVLGCQRLEPDLCIGGVVLNQVAGTRHCAVTRDAIESACGIPVLGAIPRMADIEALLPARHLGLVPPAEHREAEQFAARLRAVASAHLEVDRLLELAGSAPPLASLAAGSQSAGDGGGLRIGVVRDSAFTFYYPENLEALEASGATLVTVSALDARRLPDQLDALYIGGGFPETHGADLSANRAFLRSLGAAAARGLPIYAECGGLMLLARSLRWKNETFEMAGVLPIDLDMSDAPQGHGYVELDVDRPNPFFPVGTRLRGHEFHYSRPVASASGAPTCCSVSRGTGLGDGRDAITTRNVWASYTHLHAIATPAWAARIIAAARRSGRLE